MLRGVVLLTEPWLTNTLTFSLQSWCSNCILVAVYMCSFMNVYIFWVNIYQISLKTSWSTHISVVCYECPNWVSVFKQIWLLSAIFMEFSHYLISITTDSKGVSQFSLPAETVRYIWLPPRLSRISCFLQRLLCLGNSFLQRLSVWFSFLPWIKINYFSDWAFSFFSGWNLKQA